MKFRLLHEMPIGGERVEVSGIYSSKHNKGFSEHNGEHVLMAGQYFPRCTVCGNCEYTLIEAAPSFEIAYEIVPPRKRVKPGP